MDAALDHRPVHNPPPTAAPRSPSKPPASPAKQNSALARMKRKDDARLWVPRGSTAYKTIELSLSSENAQKLFHLAFVNAQRSLHLFFDNLPENDQAMIAAEKVINTKFEDVEKRFKLHLDTLKATASAVVADPMSGYSSPIKLEIRMYTPEAGRFASLLLCFDEIERWIEVVHFAGKMSRHHRKNLRNEIYNALVKFARQIHNLHMESVSAKREAEDNREEARRLKIAKAAAVQKQEAREIAQAKKAAALAASTHASTSVVDDASQSIVAEAPPNDPVSQVVVTDLPVAAKKESAKKPSRRTDGAEAPAKVVDVVPA